ncbi:MAG TPA: 50S ribosomal protein L4 [Kiritimatiellia bacterium]|nr:50S ribosomal protein L4 [Kiritimatiellia bacterium]
MCNMEGVAVGTVDVPPALLNTEKGAQAVRDAIVAYRANQRVGSANTKTKGEVAGHGQKPWRQKGTGNARAGYKQSPVWRGGGVVFGPKPRDFGKNINRKTLRLALARIVADRISENAVTVIDRITLPDAKTKSFAAWLKKMDIRRGIIVADDVSKDLILASRNIPGVEVVRASQVHVYQIARYPRLIVTQGALAILNRRATGTKEAA